MNGSSGHDETLLDAVAVYALGALPEAEAREVAAHIARCSDCAAEYRDLRGTADLIGYAAEAEHAPSELQSARMKNALLRAIRTDATPATQGAQSQTAAPQGTPAQIAPPRASAVRELPARPKVPWLAYLAAAACLAVAFLSTFQLGNLRAQHDKDAQQVALLHAQLDQQERTANEARGRLALAQSLLSDLVAPGAERFPVQRGLVARSNGRIIIALQHLPALPKGKVYQAWTLRKGAKTVAPSITFTPDASGLAVIELPGNAADLAAVAMSVEPEGGSKAPTSTPAFVRPLS